MTCFTLVAFLTAATVFRQASSATQKLTYYWVVHEKEFRLGSEARLNTCDGKNLAKVSKEFADRIAVEGSGYLRNGKTVLSLSSCISDSNPCRPANGNNYNCFEKAKSPVGSRDNPLVPFVSVASNGIPFGTTGIVREFVGKKTPRGETHNGCVRVDDSCSTCKTSTWIDFYAFAEKNYKYFNKNWRLSTINFQAKPCAPKKYRV